MSLKDLMTQYFKGEMDAISLIRILSGMFNPEQAVNILTLICTITRHEQGDIDTDTFNAVWKFGIDLEFNNGDYPKEYDDMPMEVLKELLEKMQKDQEALSNDIKENGVKEDEDGISNTTDAMAQDHDISLLISYLMHRDRKNAREARAKEKENESSPQA